MKEFWLEVLIPRPKEGDLAKLYYLFSSEGSKIKQNTYMIFLDTNPFAYNYKLNLNILDVPVFI